MSQLRLFVLVCVAMAGRPTAVLHAQRIPDLNAPRKAAEKAADAENARLSAQTGQAAPVRRGAAAPAPAVVATPKSGPAATTPAAAAPGASAASALPPGVVPVTREVYAYSTDGRRDPFYSLILTEDLRPLLSDLKLVGILYSGTGAKSVAIMRDVLTNAQYRVNVGMMLGRLRVAQIKPRAVIFSVEEFGLSRLDSLFLADTSKTRIR